jgi:glycosyltransferase involved in cell wall biosynthesis
MKQKLLIVLESNAKRAPRLFNEFEALKNIYDIYLLGDACPDSVSPDKFFQLETFGQQFKKFHNKKKNYLFNKISNQLLKLKVYLWSNQKCQLFNDFNFHFKLTTLLFYKMATKFEFDVILCHHINKLPACALLAKERGAKLIVNLHEYYPLEFEERIDWKEEEIFRNKICKSFLPNADLILCVNNSIRKEYINNFNLEPNKIIEFPNSKDYYELYPSDIDSKKIKLVHHGATNPSRKIELMIEMMSFLPSNYTLYLMLMDSNLEYFNTLKANESERIIFVPTVPTKDIPHEINKYDIGVYIMPYSNFNEEYALPNKFFEYVQARLAIAIGPTKEMEVITNKHELGVVSKSFKPEDLAQEILSLSAEDILRFKSNSNTAARHLSTDSYYKVLTDKITQL